MTTARMAADPPTRGGFFAVDSRAWALVCRAGMNAAVCYLVLARGTGPDNRTTAWSINAVERYTGISRHRGADAIQSLQKIQSIRQTEVGTRPRYFLTPAHELPGFDPRPPLGLVDKRILDDIKRGKPISGRSDIAHARALVGKGWLREPEVSVHARGGDFGSIRSVWGCGGVEVVIGADRLGWSCKNLHLKRGRGTDDRREIGVGRAAGEGRRG